MDAKTLLGLLKRSILFLRWLLKEWLLVWIQVRRAFPVVGRMWDFTKEVMVKYNHDDCWTYAASISFFLTISLIPLATLFFKLLALTLGSGAYSLSLQKGISQMYGFLPDHFIQDTIVHSKRLGGLNLSWVILLVGAHWGVNQLDRSLSHIFGLRVKPHRATRKYHLFRRLAVVVVGLVFLVILMTAGFELILRKHAPFFASAFSLTILPALLGLVLTTLILQHLPRRHVRFTHAILGASITSTFWLLAKWGFGIYLDHTPTWGILYGSLGSLMAALVFLYYSCCLFLLGAEVTAAFYRHDSTRSDTAPAHNVRRWLR